MQRSVSNRCLSGLNVFAFIGLVLALAACQPAPVTQAVATATPLPTEAPTVAPTATLEQATPALSEPAATQGEQAFSAPGMLKETVITYPTRLIWSMDGKRLAVLGEGSLTVLNADSFELIAVRGFQSPARALDFSPDGKTLAFSPDGQMIELDDIDSGQILQSISPDTLFQHVVFSPDGRWLAVDSTDQMAYTLWEVATGQKGTLLSGFVTAAPIYSADFSPSGSKLIWYARGTIQVQDISSAALSTSIGHEDFITSFALNPADNLLATSAGGTFQDEYTPLIYLWNPESGEQIAAYPQAQVASALAFSPDGVTLAAGIGAEVLLVDPGNGQITQSFQAADDALTALAFSPDGRYLATAGSDGHVRLWRLK
jgi:WD40 repeat protein